MTQLESALRGAEGYCELGMWHIAWNHLERLPNVLRCHVEVVAVRLRIHIGLRRWNDAILLGESLCEDWPQRPEFYHATVHAFEMAGCHERARKFLHNAPSAIWNHAESWYVLARILANLKEGDHAKAALKSCFKIDPRQQSKAGTDPLFATI